MSATGGAGSRGRDRRRDRQAGSSPEGGRRREGAARPPGLRFTESAPLVASALALLQDAPRPGADLARRVLALRRAPPGLAERLAFELLGADPRATVDGCGMWRLRRSPREGGGSLPLDAVRFAVVDVETTGGAAGPACRIVEIAVVQVREGRIGSEFSSLVNPGIPISPWVTRLTGITAGMVADAPPFAEIAVLVRRSLEGRVFAAHHAAFDWRCVSAELQRAGCLLPSGPRLCTLRLARRALPGISRRGLDAVAGYYGIEIRRRHRAPDDALATARLLLRLLEEAERRGIEDWDGLLRWVGQDGRSRGSLPREAGDPGPGGRGRC